MEMLNTGDFTVSEENELSPAIHTKAKFSVVAVTNSLIWFYSVLMVASTSCLLHKIDAGVISPYLAGRGYL